MRAILIDPFERTVEEIDVPNSGGETIKAKIGAPYFDIARMGSTVIGFVDDQGLCRKGQRFWHFDHPGGGVLMAGRCLIMSVDEEGETVGLDIRATLAHTKRYVEFLGNGEEAEGQILAGLLKRPNITLNGDIIWEWSPEKQVL